jgi:hypothetical protein
MRGRSTSTRAGAALVVGCAWALVGAASCGGSSTPATGTGVDAEAGGPPDAGPDEVDVDADSGAGAGTDSGIFVDTSDAPDADAAPAGDVADGPDVDAAAADAPVDRAPVSDGPGADLAEGGIEASHDLPVERASATATWTLDPNAACSAAGAGCMDTGAVGGYEVTASGTCGAPSSLQLWFPGGSSSLAVGAYAVKAASGILDVISMPAGMVGVLVERDGATTERDWGRSGTVTVTASGTTRRVTFTGVAVRDETSSAMTTLAADVTCP